MEMDGWSWKSGNFRKCYTSNFSCVVIRMEKIDWQPYGSDRQNSWMQRVQEGIWWGEDPLWVLWGVHVTVQGFWGIWAPFCFSGDPKALWPQNLWTGRLSGVSTPLAKARANKNGKFSPSCSLHSGRWLFAEPRLGGEVDAAIWRLRQYLCISLSQGIVIYCSVVENIMNIWNVNLLCGSVKMGLKDEIWRLDSCSCDFIVCFLNVFG